MAFRQDIINIPTTYVPSIDKASDAVQRSLCLDVIPVYIHNLIEPLQIW